MLYIDLPQSPAGSKFIFGGNEIEIYEDGSAHLTATGGLAGSTLRLNEGLRILVEDIDKLRLSLLYIDLV